MSNLFIGEPSGEPVYIDDFSALSDLKGWRLTRGNWGARRGQLLFGDPGKAGVLTFAPNLRGEHAIYVGGFAPHGRQLGIYIRIEGEPHFNYMQTVRLEPSYERMYFKTADLTGKRIEIGGFDLSVCLDYIEFVPVHRKLLPKATGSTLGILDFADDAGISRPVDYEAGSAVRRHAEVGYDLIMWKAYAVRCEYHTKIGDLRSYSHAGEAAETSDLMHMQNRGIADVLRRYDTMRQAVDVAKEIGLPIFGWARINNEFSKPDHQFSATTWFHKANPDKFQLSRDGKSSCKLSFAYPEVRQHKIDILLEMLGYGMDGLFIDVLRHPPLVQFDQPIVDGYIQKTGKDPRQMEGDGDEAWLRYRAEKSFTLFLREVRAAMDKQSGGRVPLYIRTMDQDWRNLVSGCDTDAWMDEGIVDGIVFGSHCHDATNTPETMDLSRQVMRAKGKVKIYGQIWRYGSVRQSLALASDLYGQGVDGVALYESNATVGNPAWRENLWRLSRPDQL